MIEGKENLGDKEMGSGNTKKSISPRLSISTENRDTGTAGGGVVGKAAMLARYHVQQQVVLGGGVLQILERPFTHKYNKLIRVCKGEGQV